MKAIALEVGKGTATVMVRPSWLARLFGARDTIVELNIRRCRSCSSDAHEVLHWQIAVTGRFIDPRCGGSRDGKRIMRALEYRPHARLPGAHVVPSGDRGSR